MSVVAERYLRGQETSLEHLLHYVDRNIRPYGTTLRPEILRRIEIRLSARLPTPLTLEDVRARVRSLLLEHNHGHVQLSIRPFELAMDDARGANLVRIITNDSELPPGRLARCGQAFRTWFFERPPAPVAPTPPAQGAEAAADTSPSLPWAMEQLDSALERGCSLARATLGTQPVAHASVVIRSPALHAALSPLLAPADPSGTAKWVHRELRKHNIPVQDDLDVTYRFDPPLTGVTTRRSEEDEIELRLAAEGGGCGSNGHAEDRAAASGRW